MPDVRFTGRKTTSGPQGLTLRKAVEGGTNEAWGTMPVSLKRIRPSRRTTSRGLPQFPSRLPPELAQSSRLSRSEKRPRTQSQASTISGRSTDILTAQIPPFGFVEDPTRDGFFLRTIFCATNISNLNVFDLHFFEQSAKSAEGPAVFAQNAPTVTCVPELDPGRLLVPVLKELVNRNFHRACQFFKRL
jgi:hypothetical protein